MASILHRGGGEIRDQLAMRRDLGQSLVDYAAAREAGTAEIRGAFRFFAVGRRGNSQDFLLDFGFPFPLLLHPEKSDPGALSQTAHLPLHYLVEGAKSRADLEKRPKFWSNA